MKLLSVVMPCFNEQDTIHKIVEHVCAADIRGLDLELVIVDDGSRDR